MSRIHAVCGVAAALLVTSWSLAAGGATAWARASVAPSARGSAEQAYAIGLDAHASAHLTTAGGRTVQSARADAQGGVLFHSVRPGPGYRIASGAWRSSPLRVYGNGPAPRSTRTYDQSIHAGYGYLTVRDGTRLAIDVHLPHVVSAASLLSESPPANASIVRVRSPYPTLIEYSGYGYANPAGPVNGIARLANLLGFAVVDVSMRGTGCSGGAFSYFEPNQSLDGYDVIETIARQPWVLGHRVGMLGISYGAISQLFTAAEDPPALEAIAPLSPTDSSLATIEPGGDLNTGFAYAWAGQRGRDALPFSPTADQSYARARIHAGDRVCRADQALHGEATSLQRQIDRHPFFDARFWNPLDPVTFVHRIIAPTFLACQFDDEQVGADCPDLAEHFTGARRRWFTFTNGAHIDSLDPETLVRLIDFYELYVAHRRPVLSFDLGAGDTMRAGLDAALRLLGGPLLHLVMGIPDASLHDVPSDPTERASTYRAALQRFDRTPHVTVGFDNGSAPGNPPGTPVPAFTATAARFPFPGTVADSWYLAPGGALAGSAGASGADRFTYRASEGAVTDFSAGGNLGSLDPSYHWISPIAGQAVAYLTAPLVHNTVVLGAGTVSLWVKSTQPAVDLQATITEVRPDGREVYVQNGYLRGDASRLTPGSTPLHASLTLRHSQLRPLRADRWTHITIPLYYEGHAYRAGSRIRVIIGSIGGDQPVWSFGRPTARRTATVTVGYSARMDSRLTLPVVPSIAVPTPLPRDCHALRGEPCRVYAPFGNDGS